MSKIENLYGSREVWAERLQQCCKDVEGLEKNFPEALEDAIVAEHLDPTTLQQWSSKIQDLIKHKEELAPFSSQVEDRFSQVEHLDPEMVAFLADLFHEIQNKPLFEKKHMMALLVLNHFLARLKAPLVILHASKNRLACRLELAAKVQEAVLINGELLTKKKASGYTSYYEGPFTRVGIEWHALAKAVDTWKASQIET